jgi:DNA invertase Pin-like site-specific DNA recombinase
MEVEAETARGQEAETEVEQETEQAAAMKALLDQGYSQDAVSEAFQCFPSTVRRRVRKLTERKETNDRSEIDCRNI